MNNSLVEPPFIPAWARQLKEYLFFIYNGPSMAPLFKPGDILCARKSVLGNIHLGDVIIIVWQNDISHIETVVHRVVAAKPECLITRGDNNLKPDAQAVTSDNLVGLVTSFGRQNRMYPVRNGYLGLLHARFIHARNHLWLLVRRLGWRVYRLISQSGVVAKVWRPDISQIRVMTLDGSLFKYCYGNRTVAYWRPELKKFDVVIPNPEESK